MGQGTQNFDVLDVLIANMPDLEAVIAHGKIAHGYLANATIPNRLRTHETRRFRMESYDTIDGICQELRTDEVRRELARCTDWCPQRRRGL